MAVSSHDATVQCFGLLGQMLALSASQKTQVDAIKAQLDTAIANANLSPDEEQHLKDLAAAVTAATADPNVPPPAPLPVPSP